MTIYTHPLPTTGTPPMIGVCLSTAEWLAYLPTVPVPTAPAVELLVLHHTYTPTLDQWRGLATMRGMQTYYRGLGWSAAPHLYIGPDGIWLFTPLTDIGVHANAGNGSVKAGWYSIGIEMVGRYDTARPTGIVWEQTVAVLGSLCQHFHLDPAHMIDPHRKYNTGKSCPGWAVDMAWVVSEVQAWIAAQSGGTPTPPTAGYTADSPILGTPQATVDQATHYVLRRPTGEYTAFDVGVIVKAYFDQATGVDPVLAVAQMIHETGNLTSAWAARPHRNPAGIGVDGTPGAGVSFPTWVYDSVPAHVGRLLAYALPPGTGTVAQEAAITKALSYRPLPAAYRGVAPTLRGLEGRWAVPGTGYGSAIAGIATAIRGA